MLFYTGWIWILTYLILFSVYGCCGGEDDDCEGEEEPAGEEKDIVSEVRGCGPGGSTAREVNNY